MAANLVPTMPARGRHGAQDRIGKNDLIVSANLLKDWLLSTEGFVSMQTEYRAVASWEVEDEATGMCHTMNELKKFEVRKPCRFIEIAGETGRRLELDDGESAAHLGDNRFRAGMRTFRSVLA